MDGKCKDGNEWCDKCDTEFVKVEYDNLRLCRECFLKVLEKKNDGFDSYKETQYYLDGEFIGSDDDIESVIEALSNRVDVTVVKDN